VPAAASLDLAMTVITPTLFIGERPDIQDAYQVSSVSEAVQLIRDGLAAVIPEGDWQLAEEVLRAVTDDHDAISRALRFARENVLGVEPCMCPSCVAWVTRR
jgi:hypothetical protein